jgi:hypothetical protein
MPHFGPFQSFSFLQGGIERFDRLPLAFADTSIAKDRPVYSIRRFIEFLWQEQMREAFHAQHCATH